MARKNGNWASSFSNAISMATTFVACIALGLFLGKYLDRRLSTEPVLTILLFLLGTATGLKLIYEQAFGGKKEKEGFLPGRRDDPEEKSFAPSKEMIEALHQAKNNLAGLDTAMRPAAEEKSPNNGED